MRTKGRSWVGGDLSEWQESPLEIMAPGGGGVSLAPFIVAFPPFLHTLHLQHETKPANYQ